MKYVAKLPSGEFIASRYRSNKYGDSVEGEVTLSSSRMFARIYDNADVLIRDIKLLGINIAEVVVVPTLVA